MKKIRKAFLKETYFMIYISKAAVRITVNLFAILWVGQIPNIDQVRHSIKTIQQSGRGEEKIPK